MKQENSPVPSCTDQYNILPEKEFPFTTIREAATRLKVREQRISRMLRILKIPIHKIGTLVLIDEPAVDRMRRAIKTNEVKRGRKPHAA